MGNYNTKLNEEYGKTTKAQRQKTGEMCACECHPKRGFYKHYTNFIWECEHCQQPQGEDFWDDSNSEMLREENEERTKVYKAIVDRNYKKMIESQPQPADPSASSGQGKTGFTKSQVRDKRSKQDDIREWEEEIDKILNKLICVYCGGEFGELENSAIVKPELLSLFSNKLKREREELIEQVDKEVIGGGEPVLWKKEHADRTTRNKLRMEQREKLRRIGGGE